MADKEKTQYIVLTDERPLEYWCRLLECENEDLLHALGTIGYSYAYVDLFLQLNRKKKSPRLKS